MTGRRLPWVLIGVCLAVAGLLIYASPPIIGALEIMRVAGEVQHNETVLFAPASSSGVIPMTAVVGAALALIGTAIVVARVVLKSRR